MLITVMLLYSETLYQAFLISGNFTQFFYLVLFFWAVYNYKHFKGNYSWVFVLYAVFFLMEVVTVIVLKPFDLKNNLFLDHIYLFLSVLVQSVFYFKILDDKLVQKILLYFVFFFLVSVIVLALYQEGYLYPPILTRVKYFAFLMLYLFVHQQLVRNSSISPLRNNPLYWFNLAFLIMNIYYLLFVSLKDTIGPMSNDLAFILHIIKNAIDPICCILWIISINKLRSWKPKPALT